MSHVINFVCHLHVLVYRRAGAKVLLSLVEAHDHLLLQKIGRYVEEPLKARVIDGLRPTTRAPSEK